MNNTSYKTQVTAGNFSQRLKSLLASANTQRDNVQELAAFGMQHAMENDNDFTYLSMLLDQTRGLNYLRTGTLKDWIKANVSNIQFGKLKDGSYGFRKLTKGEPCEYTPPVELSLWYEFNNSGNAHSDMYLYSRIQRVIQGMDKIISGKKEGRILSGPKGEERTLPAEDAKKLRNNLAELIGLEA